MDAEIITAEIIDQHLPRGHAGRENSALSWGCYAHDRGLSLVRQHRKAQTEKKKQPTNGMTRCRPICLIDPYVHETKESISISLHIVWYPPPTQRSLPNVVQNETSSDNEIGTRKSATWTAAWRENCSRAENTSRRNRIVELIQNKKRQSQTVD